MWYRFLTCTGTILDAFSLDCPEKFLSQLFISTIWLQVEQIHILYVKTLLNIDSQQFNTGTVTHRVERELLHKLEYRTKTRMS
jgi:hypothetical protein